MNEYTTFWENVNVPNENFWNICVLDRSENLKYTLKIDIV